MTEEDPLGVVIKIPVWEPTAQGSASWFGIDGIPAGTPGWLPGEAMAVWRREMEGQ